MKYLLDTNTFIQAKNDYYRFSFCPGYWSWILRKHQEDLIFSVDNIRTELLDGNDDLTQWTKNCPKTLFLKPHSSLPASLTVTAQWADTQSYTVAAMSTFLASADYYLIAYAHSLQFTLVTQEKSHPESKKRVMIPDVCNGLGVRHIGLFELLETEGAQFTFA